MARVEKTVFISYRRKDISWALAVYQYLTSRKYDVFFDYTSLSGGDFEQVIVSNIKARAHFVLILTPTALDRCSEPGDWLRREIETAVDERRNIIPLFFDGFNFGSPSVAEKLTGKIAAINRYNGLEIPAGYFIEAMQRLSNRYLDVPLNAVIHPVSTEVRKVVKEEQIVVNEALAQKWEDIKKILKPAEEKSAQSENTQIETATETSSPFGRWSGSQRTNLRLYGISVGILLIVVLALAGINAFRNSSERNTPIGTVQPVTNAVTIETANSPVGTVTAEMKTHTPTEEPTYTPMPLTETNIPISTYTPSLIQPSSPSSNILLETSFEELSVSNSGVTTPFLFTKDSPGIVIFSYSIHPEYTNWKIDSRSRTGNLAINVIPGGNPDTDLASTATTIISDALLDVIFNVSGYDTVSIEFWVNTTSNPRVASIHNCDSSFEVYFKTDSGGWIHKIALCGEYKTESSGWRLISLNFDVTGKSTIQFAFEYTLQSNPTSDPTVYYLIDDLSVTAK